MKFDKPVDGDFKDALTIVGKAISRIDGPAKTTGTAKYAYERHDVSGPQLVGYPVTASIARGRIVSIDTSRATSAPGVVTVLTTLEHLPLPGTSYHTATLFGGDQVEHYHQAIAVVVAKSFEEARSAANLVSVTYEKADGDFDLRKALEKGSDEDREIVSSAGDFETAYAAADVKLDAVYTTPGQSHAMMEPHASIAEWEGERLTLWTSNQMIRWNVDALALALDMPAENIRVDSPYIGGGFGSKLFLRADGVLAALAARKTGKPVKVMLPRPIIANNTTHRAATIQTIRIGATRAGRITALYHEGLSGNLPGGDPEDATAQTPKFYAMDTHLVVRRLATVHLPEGNAMRAPGETSGLMALEIAMDEMAEKLGMDPVDFRVLNDTQTAPHPPNKPFSRRNYTQCLRTGAEKFGWADRNPAPGSRREGQWLIGHGMAGAYRGGPITASGARARLLPDGRIRIETDMTDIGTGSYTIIAQTAAEMMGVPISQVEVSLGDSRHPASAGSGGQWGAASSTAGALAACLALQRAIAGQIGEPHESLSFREGHVHFANASLPLTRIAEAGELQADGALEVGEFRKKVVVSTFAAHFVEVGVHIATGETRVRRMLAVCDAGRILNPMTARSQVIGAMTMGVGAALMEELAPDTRHGFFANHDLAGYEVPVHADIPEQDVIFIEDLDPYASPMQAKGVGELGLCGVSAAVANAVYNATGVRVRDYPVTLSKLLSGLPALA